MGVTLTIVAACKQCEIRDQDSTNPVAASYGILRGVCVLLWGHEPFCIACVDLPSSRQLERLSRGRQAYNVVHVARSEHGSVIVPDQISYRYYLPLSWAAGPIVPSTIYMGGEGRRQD